MLFSASERFTATWFRTTKTSAVEIGASNGCRLEVGALRFLSVWRGTHRSALWV
jgi:hypothetical protein